MSDTRALPEAMDANTHNLSSYDFENTLGHAASTADHGAAGTKADVLAGLELGAAKHALIKKETNIQSCHHHELKK